MTIPRPCRRWVVLAFVALIALGTLRLLDQPLALESYRVVEPQTLVVTGHGAKNAWTHVTSVTETDATVVISVNSLELTGFLPQTGEGHPIDVEVHVGAPLGSRAIVDGSTGLPLARTD